MPSWTSSDYGLFSIRTTPTEHVDIRQFVIRFGASGYIVRYAVLAGTADILITRIWHGRESRV
jgi:hypothetical protein